MEARGRVCFAPTTRFSYDSPDRLRQLERNFVLDCVPLSKLSNDEVNRTKPSLNIGIPQYNASQDPACKIYFKKKEAQKVDKGGTGSAKLRIVPESSVDKFLRNSSATKYLNDRKQIGAGYTRRIYGGHLTVPTALPGKGYNGDEGYRRNTPDLRKKPSVFDCEDIFDTQKLSMCRSRTQSAPATARLIRQKSARLYREVPVVRTRAMSAVAAPRELFTGPPT